MAQDDEKCTDVGNARRLVSTYPDRFRFVPDLGWLAWDGARWKPDSSGEVIEAAKEVARNLYSAAGDHPDEARRKALAAWATKSESRARIEAMVSLARTDPGFAATVGELDIDPWALNTPTGTLDLKTGKLRPHRPGDLITKITTASYDPGADCPQFMQFLTEICRGRAELVEFLQRAVGCSLVGAVQDHVLFLAIGNGANGKSTFLNVIQDVLGDYAGSAEPDLLVTRREPHPTGIADLRGRRFVVATETAKQRRLDEAVTKRLTGGDRVKARLMRGDFFEFRPSHTIWLATNDEPQIVGTDNGIWRRLMPIPFDLHVTNLDPALPAVLALEGEGVLAWAVAGALEWQSRGLDPPPCVRLALKDYRSSEDTVGRWLHDFTEAHRDGWQLASDLFEDYTNWCAAQGEVPWSQTALGKELSRRGYDSDRNRGGARGRCWLIQAARGPAAAAPVGIGSPAP